MAHTYRILVGNRGRVVLPSPVRAELGLEPGTHLLLNTEPDGTLRIRPYRQVADQARGLFAPGDGGSLVDELLRDRRAERDAGD
jgi:AbrB family looped-hinge helix DNA binding protein